MIIDIVIITEMLKKNYKLDNIMLHFYKLETWIQYKNK